MKGAKLQEQLRTAISRAHYISDLRDRVTRLLKVNQMYPFQFARRNDGQPADVLERAEVSRRWNWTFWQHSNAACQERTNTLNTPFTLRNMKVTVMILFVVRVERKMDGVKHRKTFGGKSCWEVILMCNDDNTSLDRKNVRGKKVCVSLYRSVKSNLSRNI